MGRAPGPCSAHQQPDPACPRCFVADHTPGPWTLIGASGDGKSISIRGEGDGWHRLEVDVDSDDCDFDTAMANAKLVSAAPDLLAACQMMLGLRDVSELPRAEAMMRIAVAKAIGEPLS